MKRYFRQAKWSHAVLDNWNNWNSVRSVRSFAICKTCADSLSCWLGQCSQSMEDMERWHRLPVLLLWAGYPYFHRLPTWPRHCPGQDHNERCHRFALQRAARPARDVETLGLTTSHNISNPNGPMALSRRRNCQLVPDRACRLKKTSENHHEKQSKDVQKMSKRCPTHGKMWKVCNVCQVAVSKGHCHVLSLKESQKLQPAPGAPLANLGKPTCSVLIRTETYWNHLKPLVRRCAQASPGCPKLPQAACPLPLKDVSAKRLRLSPGSCSMLRQASNRSI